MFPSESAAGPEPFGKYLLDREIARGGMARVHLARLRGLGGFEKRLVVKQILPHLASDPRFVSMFVEEAKTLVQMSHPHIVPVYELGIVDGVYFLAMEYVEGATLHEVLEDGPLEPAQAAHVGAQICDALSYAHERFAIVHRDVTPRNVIVDGAGHCRLLDFGIAAPAEDDAAGALFGTPGYLSPEQARGESIGPSSDLFALGAALHHALTGEPPFDAQDLDAVRALSSGDEARSLATRGIEEELAKILDRPLAIDKAARPESARALGRALRGWLATHHPEGVASELGLRAERARLRRDRRRASERPPGSGPKTGEVRSRANGAASTLAQSRSLEELIEGTTPLSREPAPPSAGSSEHAPDDAAPPEHPAHPDVRPSGTLALPGRIGRTTTTTQPPRSRRAAIIAVIGSAVAVLGSLLMIGVRDRSNAPAPREHAIPAAQHAVQASPDDPTPEDEPVSVPETVVPVHVPSADAPGSAFDAPGSAAEPTPDEARPPRATASLAISSRDWAEIRIDGRVIGTTPIRRVAIAAGDHEIIAINAPLGLSATAEFRADPGGHLHAVVDFRATPPRIVLSDR